MSNDDELNFIPSILNPRTFRNTGNTLTQRSTITRRSLSLKRNNSSVFCNNSTNISISKKKECNNLSALQKKNVINQIEKEIVKNTQNLISMNKSTAFTDCLFYNNVKDDAKLSKKNRCTDGSLGSSAIKDFVTLPKNSVSSQISIDKELEMNKIVDENDLILTLSSATELNNDLDVSSDQTILYDNEKPTISVSFGVSNCNTVDLNTKKSNFKKVLVSCENNNITVDCDVVESSQMSEESAFDENMNKILNNPQKRSAVAVNLEVKKKKLSDKEENKVLILNTNAIGKLSHVIIQQPSYNLDKRKKFESKLENSGRKSVYSNNGLCKSVSLKQDTLDSYFSSSSNVPILSELTTLNKSHNVSRNSHFCQGVKTRNDNQDMSKNLSADIKNERAGKLFKGIRKDEMSPKSAKVSSRRGSESPKLQASSSDAPRALSPRGKNDTASSHSPRKNVESLQFNLPCKTRSNKSSVATKNIPHYKIVAGTHFAVDAFSYGDIPNVKHYFLTHFHSDHYSGLKKSFNKLLFCSKITADLCTSRLGVNPKCIHIINLDETMRVEGVEVTAIDANHCPGAVMLVFTLPSNKTILHTGDFRATPIMESYPIFWNKDIHTIYLDTTYCNPRYDFPTQEQSLEMALYLLRQKKLLLEKAGKKFSSVLIVCGTYTIGKEKFFLGMARRVGCAVWACPEKDRVLQAVEGRSFGQAPPHECQLHVVPMRDLTHEKLRSYLDSLQGAFSEVVAFKPSGWENGKNTTSEENMITIHGIPYSEHSSFSEMIRFVKFLKPKQVVPTVDISGGIKSVQKHFPCPLILKEDIQYQSKVTDFFSIQNRQQMSAVT